MAKEYVWKGYRDYCKQLWILEEKLRKLPLKKRILIWRVGLQVFPAYYRKYLQKSDVSILVSASIFYIIFIPIITLNFSIATIPIIAAVFFIFLLICFLSIQLIPTAYFPLMLEKKALMIEDIAAFAKAEMATMPPEPLPKLLLKKSGGIVLGLAFAGILFILQQMFCAVLV